MSFFQYTDIDMGAGNVQIGTIASVDYKNLKATVSDLSSVGGRQIDIHYHCEKTDIVDDKKPFEQTYPNEMDLLGASAFAVEDSVRVMFRGAKNTRPVIVGFADDPKVCCKFLFSLVGSDGPELVEGVIFAIYDELQNSMPITDLTYNEEEEYWEFSLNTDQEDVECIGPFWAKYFKAGYKSTQYQGKNTSENFWLEGDLIIMPDATLYFDVMELLEGEMGYWEDWEDNLLCGKQDWYTYRVGESYVLCDLLDGFSIENNVMLISLTGEVEESAYGELSWSTNPYWSERNKPIPSWKYRKAKVKLQYAGGPYSWAVMWIYDESGFETDLFISPCGSYCPEFTETFSKIEIGDNDGKEMELDFEDFGLTTPIIDIWIAVLANWSETASLAIDYIHFSRWEEWGEILCENNNWLNKMASDSNEISCPSVPRTVEVSGSIYGGTGNISLNEISDQNNSFSMTCNADAGKWFWNYVSWNRTANPLPDGKIPELGSIVIKFLNNFNSNIEGDLQFGEGYIYIRQASDQAVCLFFAVSEARAAEMPKSLAGGALWHINIVPDIVLGEELIIDLTQYDSLVAGEEIQFVTIWIYGGSEEDGKSVSLGIDIDYIDFI